MIRYKLLNKIRLLSPILLLTNLQACTPMIHPAGTPVISCQISDHFYITSDGALLPLRSWKPPQKEIQSIIIALHGFNDYSNFFQHPGDYFSQSKTVSYAYDQRGFGGSPDPGSWAGVDTYIQDLECFIQAIKNKHPNIPIYLLGVSMGGAIVISTMAQSIHLPVDGIILAAPAVWARQTMPWYQNVLLWTLSHTVPWLTLTGNGLGRIPSDNIEMLRALDQDSLVIRKTRVESIFGLVNLMDQALSSADHISTRTLLLYGERDEIIPKEPTYQFLHDLTDAGANRHVIAIYENGYHMLLRDLQASVLWRDIEAWINSPSSPLPSGADKRAQELIEEWMKGEPHTSVRTVRDSL